jgi:hypothetical protein
LSVFDEPVLVSTVTKYRKTKIMPLSKVKVHIIYTESDDASVTKCHYDIQNTP